ncbi:MAG: hypothetical protein GY755_20855 [Chloroflexi bacterium]|nr:hypothetical protein [Chloroflexota bacterium]
MIAIGAIKEAFRLFIKNKTLWTISLVLISIYTLLARFFNAISMLWVLSFLLFLYLAFLEIILINAVNNSYHGESTNIKIIQVSIKKYGLRMLAIPLVYIFLFSMFLCVVIAWGSMSLEAPSELGFFLVFAVGILFLYLLPYYFSSRFVVLENMKIWKSIYETFKLYWGRILETTVLAFFVGTMNAGIIAINMFLSFSLLTLFGHSLEPSWSISFVSEMLNAPIGTFITLILSAFSVLWSSSTITIYFKKLEELGEFGE